MNAFDVLEKLGALNKKDFSRARLKAGYDEHVNKWRAYYNGNVVGVNSDTGFNGQESFTFERKSMRVAKQIATKWATLLFTEQFKVTLIDEAETEKFNQLEKQLDFRAKITQAAISGYALGTAALLASADIKKENINGKTTGGKLKLDVIRYDNIFPLSFDQNDITSIAFVSQRQAGDSTIYNIGIYSNEDNKTVVENITATVKGETISFKKPDKVTYKQAFDNTMYAIIKPNTINDFSDVLPFGQSIFSDALAPCEDIDLAAYLLRRDIIEGEQLTFVGRDLVMDRIGKDGNKKKLFENTKKFYVIPQKLGEGGNDLKQLFEKSTPEIRTNDLWKVIQDSLNWACLTSGLGKGSLDIQAMPTATQVIHTEAEKMQNKSLHEQLLEVEIIKLVKSLCELSTKINNPIDASTVNITWQDAILVDTDTAKRMAMAEVDAGIISKEEYRQKFMGETYEEAKKRLEEITDDDNFSFSKFTHEEIEK